MNLRTVGLGLIMGLTTLLIAVIFLTPFGAAHAAGDGKADIKQADNIRHRPSNFDALASAPISPNAARQPTNNGRSIQTDARFDVPTFLWASDPGPAAQLSRNAVERKGEEVAAARGHLSKYADSYRLKKSDLLAARVASVHDTGSGAIVVKLRQDIGGIEVFRDEVNVIMNRDLQLVAISGYLTGDHSDHTSAAGNYNLQPEDALSKALGDLTGNPVDTSLLRRTAVSKKRGVSVETDGYTRFTGDKDSLPGFILSDEPSRTKQVMFHLPEGYVPAYYVETSILVPTTATDILSATGEQPTEEWGYAYVVSAVDGQILFRMNQVAEQYSYRVWADPSTKIPYDTPAGNSVHPKIAAAPDGTQYSFLPQQDVTLSNFPFSQNDPWLPIGATETVGNNVDAFLNLFSPDGFGNPTTTVPTDVPTGDYRAQITGANSFLHTNVAGTNTGLAEARQGSIQQLFYNVNFLHDWFYDAGFNEAAGNAQTNNYGRGGLAADNIKAQVHDFAGFSNANMLTPADGARPRMRMYVFPSIASVFDVTSTPAAAGKRNIGISMAGPQAFDVTGEVVKANFSNSPAACTVTNAAALAGKIALFDFDNVDGTGCSFSTRITKITATSATSVVMVYTASNPNVVANITGFVSTFTKPVATISWNGAATIKTELAVPNVVTARLFRDADRDGSIDNQIVAHEWGHYISNRLIGNATGLNTNMAGGLGEGWGDFTGLLLTVRPDDTTVPSNASFNGAYALATYATSGVNPLGAGNDGYYYGIRRVPYSTDLNINPLTFRHIANGQTVPAGPPIAFGADGSNNAEVHNTGEVWTTMLWECYAALLRDTQGASPRLTFPEAQTRMKNYLVAAYKMTPNSPTLLEARDAVLAAASANDPMDGVLFGQAFAKRGAGLRAVAPDRYSTTNVGVTESYANGGDISYVQSTLDDSIRTIDNDGYLDMGETGLLKVTLRNSGVAAISATTSQIVSDNVGLTFPSGTTISFPAVGPGGSATASVVVHCAFQPGIMKPVFTITSNDPGIAGESESLIPSPVVSSYSAYVNLDVVPNSSKTDSVEPEQTFWTVSSNPGLDQSAASKFRRSAEIPLNYSWFAPDPSAGSDQYLTSPLFTVDGSGSFNVQFDHKWGFEFDAGGNYDGGVIEMSVNGGAYTDIGATAYNGSILNYAGTVNPLAGRSAFVKSSAGTVHTSLTRAVAPGSTVQIRFRAASDSVSGGTGWFIDNIAFAGVVETPFGTLIPDLAPTAAPVSVSGRVTNSSGRYLYRVTVSMTDGQGVTRTAVTSPFGYFEFDNVRPGSTYIFQANAKGYRFAPRVVSVNDNLSDVDFTAEQ